MDLTKQFNKQDLKTIIVFALENSQSQSFEQLATKNKLLKKLGSDGEITFTTDEILIIKTACLQTLKDGATLSVIGEICPNDL